MDTPSSRSTLVILIVMVGIAFAFVVNNMAAIRCGDETKTVAEQSSCFRNNK